MYDDERESAMTAGSIEEKIRELRRLAQKRADEQDKDIDDVVHNLTHDSYLMKYTTSDVLQELQELDDAFYNGAANEHLIEYTKQDVNFEFWYDYLYMFLAAGLEWAVLKEAKEHAANVDS